MYFPLENLKLKVNYMLTEATEPPGVLTDGSNLRSLISPYL